MRRTLVVLASLLGLAGCSATSSDTTTTPVTEPSAPGSTPSSGLIDIGDRSLYLECEGSGDPTVMLEAGLAGDHRTWEDVMPRISPSSRVCSYNRANILPSESAPTPRTADDMVADLRALLMAAHEDPPYVLVGSSFGGLVTQLYASSHSAEIAGMVLVDSNHPDEVEKFATELTAAQIEEDHEFVNSNEEGVDVFASFKEVQGAPPLPDLPLVVVTAGISEGWPPGWDAKVFDRLRAEQQADLARLVPDGTQLIARKSAHDVPLQQPDVVVKAIESVLAQAR